MVQQAGPGSTSTLANPVKPDLYNLLGVPHDKSQKISNPDTAVTYTRQSSDGWTNTNWHIGGLDASSLPSSSAGVLMATDDASFQALAERRHTIGLAGEVRAGNKRANDISDREEEAMNEGDREEIEDTKREENKAKPQSVDEDDDDDDDSKKHLFLLGEEEALIAGGVLLTHHHLNLHSIDRILRDLRKATKEAERKHEKARREAEEKKRKADEARKESERAKEKLEEAKREAEAKRKAQEQAEAEKRVAEEKARKEAENQRTAKENPNEKTGSEEPQTAEQNAAAAKRAQEAEDAKLAQQRAAAEAELATQKEAQAARDLEKATRDLAKSKAAVDQAKELEGQTKKLARVAELREAHMPGIGKMFSMRKLGTGAVIGIFGGPAVMAMITYALAPKNMSPEDRMKMAEKVFMDKSFSPEAREEFAQKHYWEGAKIFGKDIAVGLRDSIQTFLNFAEKGGAQDLLNEWKWFCKFQKEHPEDAQLLAQSFLMDEKGNLPTTMDAAGNLVYGKLTGDAAAKQEGTSSALSLAQQASRQDPQLLNRMQKMHADLKADPPPKMASLQPNDEPAPTRPNDAPHAPASSLTE